MTRSPKVPGHTVQIAQSIMEAIRLIAMAASRLKFGNRELSDGDGDRHCPRWGLRNLVVFMQSGVDYSVEQFVLAPSMFVSIHKFDQGTVLIQFSCIEYGCSSYTIKMMHIELQ